MLIKQILYAFVFLGCTSIVFTVSGIQSSPPKPSLVFGTTIRVAEAYASSPGAVGGDGCLAAEERLRSGNIPIQSTFQVSKISKPLWSVGKLCDAGFKVEFGKSAAIVTHEKTGTKIGEFKRNQGLYVGALQLRNPSFPRQARK